MEGRFRGRIADADLVQAALLGGKDAFAELVTRHRATAAALATRVLGSADLARDAVQEATVAAMVSLDRLRSPDRFGAWFCGITLNVARRWLRQLRAEPPAVSIDRASDDQNPEERAEVAEVAAAVRAAVAGLAAGQRQAVYLFYLQGLTHREVATELAISVGAVKARLHQARAALIPSLAPLIDTVKESTVTKTARGASWVDVGVAEVRRSDAEVPVHVMVLEEQSGPRRLPIWIGPAEAATLALNLESQEIPRPLAYQMAAHLLDATASRVSEVRITRLTETVFYAAVIVDGPTGLQEVDARPSDAVNLAIVTSAAVRVDDALLDDPRASDHPQWQSYPTHTSELAAEAWQRINQMTCQ